MKQSPVTNLFGWNSNGKRETSRLLFLLLHDAKFRLLCKKRSEVYLIAPFKYQSIAESATPTLCISDNGGELNIGWVNRDGVGDNLYMESIPSTAHRSNLNAETMYYRIQCALDREAIDYDYRCEPLDLKVLATQI